MGRRTKRRADARSRQRSRRATAAASDWRVNLAGVDRRARRLVLERPMLAAAWAIVAGYVLGRVARA